MKIVIPRLTFRMHDNPLLNAGDIDGVVVIIEKERLPTDDYDIFRKYMNWNYHQYNLLLQTIRGHRQDLASHGLDLYLCYLGRDDYADFIKSIGKATVHTDYVTDPVFGFMTKQLRAGFGQSFKEINTFTLLDWRVSPHREVLEKYYKKAKPFSKLTPLKDHILSQDITLDPSRDPGLQSLQSLQSRSDLKKLLAPWLMDIDQELAKVHQKMTAAGMRVHKFGVEGQGSWDQQLLKHADAAIALIDTDAWSKPQTSRGIDWDKKTCQSLMTLNTSQLSPFLSIGSLSVAYFWNKIRSNNADIGSAKDQLMWREVFNATAVGADLNLTDRLSEFWNDNIDSKFLDPKAVDYSWGLDHDIIQKWQKGDIDGDAGQAMKALWTDGWLHHLRRHLVADTLTRGDLGQLWTEGMMWFRYTLLDHDAAVNRANWMWLSAVAFSSKQKVYHYGKDYIRRSTHPMVDRDDECEK